MRRVDLSCSVPLASGELDEHAYHIRTRGYALVRGFLDRPTIRALRAALERALDQYAPRPGVERSYLDRHQLHDLMIRDLDFAALLEDPRLQQLVAPHLGPYWIMYAATSSSVPPKGVNYAARLHVDSPRFHPGYVFNMGVIWTLDDYTQTSGSLKILPGSHHAEDAPREEVFEREAVKVLCEAGSLILFNARTFHRTTPNAGATWRHSMTLNACRPFMKPRMDWVRAIPPEISGALNEQARRLIGFDTRVPASMDEFYVPPEQRLYRPGQG